MGEINPGDTAWVLVSAALVLFMTPGLALFYGGMVRAKNVLNMLMNNFFTITIVSAVWVIAGYTLVFSPAAGGGIIGGLKFVGLQHVNGAPFPGLTVPDTAFMAFQIMFAVITPALITGAVAERIICRWRTGRLRPMAGCSRRAHATSPAGPWCISMRASRRSPASLCRGLGVASGEVIRPHNLTLTLIGAAIYRWKSGWRRRCAPTGVGHVPTVCLRCGSSLPPRAPTPCSRFMRKIVSGCCTRSRACCSPAGSTCISPRSIRRGAV